MMRNLTKTALLLLALLLPGMAAAYDFEVDGIYYNYCDGGNAVEVTSTPAGSELYSGVVTIPAAVTHNGSTYSVTAIANLAFRACGGLTGVNLPNSVTSIGNYAFNQCVALRNVTIPGSVTSIGEAAFMHCDALGSVTIPASVTTLGKLAFRECGALTDVYCYIADLSRVADGKSVFYLAGKDYSGRTLHVIPGTLAAYQADNRWYPYFGQIVEMDDEPAFVGDLNGDGEVNIADVNSVIDIVLGGTGGATPAADVNGDREVNIADINALINIVLWGGSPSVDDHYYVDLGLPSGTLWAIRNVGASKPEDYGDYFAWGETEPKEVYKWDTYDWSYFDQEAYFFLTKYNMGDYGGTVDHKAELEPTDDAACAHYPYGRTPSSEQIQELIDCCTWLWTQRHGVNGHLIVGPNGNSIFLPAAGRLVDTSLQLAGSYGHYWSRSLNAECSSYAFLLYFDNGYRRTLNTFDRDRGFPVRAVRATRD